MTEPVRILAFAGSLREGSFNKALVRAAVRVCPAAGVIDIADIGTLPLYDADVQRDGDPPAVAEMKQLISDADALLISTPEYNNAIPGVLKNAIDWISRPVATSPLEGKPVGIMGATDGPWGTVRAQQNLRLVLASTFALVMVRPTMFIGRATTLMADGEFVDEANLKHLELFLEGLIDWADRFRERPQRRYN